MRFFFLFAPATSREEVSLRVKSPAHWLALGAYLILSAVLIAHHEPWRDEADAWLMARDASAGYWFRVAGHSGTPFLWYAVQAPFAKLGFPYFTQGVLNGLIVAGAAFLLLFRSPLPVLTRFACLFGYYFAFEYSVVARNYGTGILLCFVVALFHRDRERWPVAYGIALALLANVSAHFFFFTAALLAPLAYDALKKRDRSLGIALVLGSVGLFLSLAQLWPADGGQTHDVGRLRPFSAVNLLSLSFFPGTPSIAFALVGAFVLIALFARLWHTPRAFVFLALTYLSLNYVFVAKYVNGLRHFGLLLIAVLTALWLGENERARNPSPARRREQEIGRIAYAALSSTLLWAIWPGLVAARSEYFAPYSRSGDVARFLVDNALDQSFLAAHPPTYGTSVLAHLPRTKTLWYPTLDKTGSHMDWDYLVSLARRLPAEEALARVKARQPNWSDPKTGVVLLFAYPLRNAESEGYVELFRTEPGIWSMTGESYFVYVPRAMALARIPTQP